MESIGSNPAELAALIAQLQEQLVTAQQNLINEQQARKNSETVLTTKLSEAEQKLSDTQKAFDASKATSLQKITEQAASINDMENHIKEIENSRDALAKKFEELYGPVEAGIRLGPQPYITPDGNVHGTLQDARMHLLSLEAGVTKVQAKTLISKAETLLPMIKKILGED